MTEEGTASSLEGEGGGSDRLMLLYIVYVPKVQFELYTSHHSKIDRHLVGTPREHSCIHKAFTVIAAIAFPVDGSLVGLLLSPHWPS